MKVAIFNLRSLSGLPSIQQIISALVDLPDDHLERTRFAVGQHLGQPALPVLFSHVRSLIPVQKKQRYIVGSAGLDLRRLSQLESQLRFLARLV